MKSLPKISFLVLAAISVIVAVVFYAGGTSGTLTAGQDSFDIPTYTNTLLVWAYILLVLSIVATIGLVVFNYISKIGNKSSAGMKTLIGVGALVVILLITFFAGSGEAMEIIGYEGTDNAGFWAQFSDMCLYTVYALLIGSFLTILGVNAYKQIKK